MPTLYFRFGGLPTGEALSVTLRDHRSSDSYYNRATAAWQATQPSYADAKIALTEEAANYLGTYVGDLTTFPSYSAQGIVAYVHDDTATTTPLMSVDFATQDGVEITLETANSNVLNVETKVDVIDGIVDQILPQVADIYTANIEFNLDNTNTKDEYTVTWRKNATILTSGITSPTIQVIKRVDGTNLIASTAMTQIGSTGSYKYDEATNRVTIGEAVLVKVQATIDAATRTWQRVLVRDAT